MNKTQIIALYIIGASGSIWLLCKLGLWLLRRAEVRHRRGSLEPPLPDPLSESALDEAESKLLHRINEGDQEILRYFSEKLKEVPG